LSGSPNDREDAGTPWLDVCAASDVPEGGVLSLQAGGRSLIVCRAGGELFAVSDRCTHAAWRLADAAIHGGEIECSLHGGRFDLRTGAATARPATRPLRTFPLRTAGERVEVQVPPPLG